MTCLNRVHVGDNRDALQWHGCYDGGWRGEIVAGAFAHPAKIGRALIRKIYDHAFAEDWLRAGDIAVDPFGGIAGTALEAGLRGVQWIGCELEPRFHELGNENISLWQSRFADLPNWTTPVLLNGDSRKLSEHVAKCGLVVSSPPYAEISTGAGGLNTKPPKHEGQQGGRTATSASQDTDQRYGASEGQLAKMVVGSPPYVDAQQLQDKEFTMNSTAVNPTPRKVGERSYAPAAMEAEGQLARMVVGSPPFSQPGSQPVGNCPSTPVRSKLRDMELEKDHGAEYGATPGQLQQETGETFWSAAAEIVEQCRVILQPGGHAIWVTKDFVRNKTRVPFSDQWQALCEMHGFKLVCRHQAMLVAHHGEQDDIFGDTKQLKTERKSFFRRLAEKKGSPEINWEDVICMVRT